MEVAINNITDVERELTVELNSEEFEPHFQKAYKKAQEKIEIPGFRKGKVPIHVLKQRFGEAIEHDSLDEIANDLYHEVARERNIRPVGEPILTDINYKRGASLSFKIKYEILPEFTLGEYKGLQIERLIHTTTDSEVKDEIARVRRTNATLLESETADDDEYVVTVDVQELDDTDYPMIGRKQKDQRWYLGDEAMEAEIKAALRNTTAGALQRVKIERQHGDHAHNTNLELRVKRIEKIQLPDLDDAFVKKITNDRQQTVAEYEQSLHTAFEKYWQERSDRRIENDLIVEIVKRHEITVPENLVNGIINSQIDDYKGRFPNKQLPDDFNEEEFRAEVRPASVFQAKWFLLRERIIEKEELKIEDAELEALAKERAEKSGIEADKLLEFFRQSEETRRRLISDKLMAMLKSSATITEKTTEEFF